MRAPRLYPLACVPSDATLAMVVVGVLAPAGAASARVGASAAALVARPRTSHDRMVLPRGIGSPLRREPRLDPSRCAVLRTLQQRPIAPLSEIRPSGLSAAQGPVSASNTAPSVAGHRSPAAVRLARVRASYSVAAGRRARPGSRRRAARAQIDRRAVRRSRGTRTLAARRA